MMMKSKHSHNKFMRLVTLPIRALGKAKDFYIRSMINCADATAYGGHMAGGTSTLPKSFSARSTRSGSDSGDDYSELVRAASVRSMGHLNEIDMLLKQHMQMRSAVANNNGNKAKFPKSCSVGMAGFMGRIDEEKPGDDLSEDGSVHANKTREPVYPRSKSVAVAF